MDNIAFMPILKWKQGEKKALRETKIIGNDFIPVIEIVEETSPLEFFEEIKTYYTGAFYFDTSRWDDEKRTELKKFALYASSKKIDAWPFIYVSDVYQQFDEITMISSRIAVNIPVPEDFEGPSNEEIITFVLEHKHDTYIDLFLNSGEVIDAKNANISFTSYKSLLVNNENKLADFNHIVVCLTSFPETLAVESGQNAEYVRYDFKIFSRLYSIFKGNRISKLLAYSDYGVTKYTETELDFRLMKYGVLPKVKYTTPDKYMVFKGEKDRAHGIYTRSFIDIAKEIINESYFYGKDFSYGDACIYQKATEPNPGPGNSTNWVAYCANHHLAAVAEQLSKLSVI